MIDVGNIAVQTVHRHKVVLVHRGRDLCCGLLLNINYKTNAMFL